MIFKRNDNKLGFCELAPDATRQQLSQLGIVGGFNPVCGEGET